MAPFVFYHLHPHIGLAIYQFHNSRSRNCIRATESTSIYWSPDRLRDPAAATPEYRRQNESGMEYLPLLHNAAFHSLAAEFGTAPVLCHHINAEQQHHP